MQWLERTPRAVVRAHVAMLARLTAEDALHAVQRVAIGMSGGKGGRATIQQWIRLAHGDEGVMRPASREEHHAMLAKLGIKVRTPKR